MRLIVLIGLAGGLGAAAFVAHTATAVRKIDSAGALPQASRARAQGTGSSRALAPSVPVQLEPAAVRNPASTPQAPVPQAPVPQAPVVKARPADAAASSGAPAAVISLGDYPLLPGASWSYRTYDTIDTGDNGIVEERGTLLVRTLAVHRHGDLTVAALETLSQVNAQSESRISWQVLDSSPPPAEAVGSADSERSAGAPSSVGAGRLHTIAEPNRLRQVLDLGAAGLRAADADLTFPLQTGMLWGDERLLARGDGLYVNRVAEPRELDLPAGRLKAWPIVYSTLPERITTWLSPGMGVVRYEYIHNGSLSRETYELIEFRRGAADTAAVIRYLEGVVRRLTDYADFWPIRASLGDDPELRALLGPLAVLSSGEMPDGTRRHVLQGDGTTLAFAQLSEADGRATQVEWRHGAGVIHVFGAVDSRAAHPAGRGS